MTRRGLQILVIGLFLANGLTACGSSGRLPDSGFSYKNLPVADGTVVAGEGHSVLFKGSPLQLSGTGVKVGDHLREIKLTDRDLALVNIAHTAGSGKVRIISIVPSIDTKVCEQQTHQLSEKNRGLDKMVELITVSIDTPFAQKRFAEEAKIRNVTFLSDYRGADFGKAHGLFLREPHILTRAVMVVDAQNVIRYLQITPELAQLPDLDEAFKFARSLVTAS
ncbi:putative Thiol peroxidase (Modular protein) [Nitrospira lenta]|uniref:Putative Thiol peroxidase (Modular protein) n=2 Tax=Nitrospira lenta TaxID=1436998 RepID=A0A330L085_9BACT|nr:putative Thiol peroxidase (Modular protein) [Nitrospira lenta]